MIKPPVHVFEDDLTFDSNKDYPLVDEYGDPLWEVVTLPKRDDNDNGNFNYSDNGDHEISSFTVNEENTETQSTLNHLFIEEENWDDECEENRTWTVQSEHLFGDNAIENDYDEFLEFDNPLRYELHG